MLMLTRERLESMFWHKGIGIDVSLISVLAEELVDLPMFIVD